MVEISERIRNATAGEWVGVDLDGTLFEYENWVAWNIFGKPIPLMIERVKAWLEFGIEVRIVTARIGVPVYAPRQDDHRYGRQPSVACRVTGEYFSDAMMIEAIQDHLEKHGLPRLRVQSHKDFNMIELWDDRAIQVVANTGKTLAELAGG